MEAAQVFDVDKVGGTYHNSHEGGAAAHAFWWLAPWAEPGQQASATPGTRRKRAARPPPAAPYGTRFALGMLALIIPLLLVGPGRRSEVASADGGASA